jgi:hypothetical protein
MSSSIIWIPSLKVWYARIFNSNGYCIREFNAPTLSDAQKFIAYYTQQTIKCESQPFMTVEPPREF